MILNIQTLYRAMGAFEEIETEKTAYKMKEWKPLIPILLLIHEIFGTMLNFPETKIITK